MTRRLSLFSPVWCLVSVALALGGCSDICGKLRNPTCDIREPSCHDTVIAELQCLRGATVTSRPPVSVVTPEEFEAALRDGADPMMMQTLQWERVLQELGLLAPEVSFFDTAVASQVASVLAYFSPTENAVFVIDRGEPMDSAEAVSVLLHEMVHAAQHQESDLAARLAAADTHEELMRTRLVVEGEATFYLLEALGWSAGYRAEELNWNGTFDNGLMDARAALDASSSPYFVVTGSLPYVIGGRYASGVWLTGGDEAVRGLLSATPTSSELMRDVWNAEAPPPERLETSPCEAPPPPDGFEPAFHDEMGPLLIYAFLRRGQRVSHLGAWDDAYHWRRDDLHVYSTTDGRVALAWRIHMSDATPALATAEEATARGLSAAATGEVVTILAGEGSEVDTWTWTSGTAGCAFP